jgi:hypothetical protein
MPRSDCGKVAEIESGVYLRQGLAGVFLVCRYADNGGRHSQTATFPAGCAARPKREGRLAHQYAKVGGLYMQRRSGQVSGQRCNALAVRIVDANHNVHWRGPQPFGI